MRRDHDPLRHSRHELPHAFLRRLRRHALLVAARRAVHEARRPEHIDVEDDVRREAVDEGRLLRTVLRRQPDAALALVGAQHPVGVAPHEVLRQRDRMHQLERLVRQRPPRQVAAEDDRIDALAADLGQDGLERRRIAVHVGQSRDAHRPTSGRRPRAGSRRGGCAARPASGQPSTRRTRSPRAPSARPRAAPGRAPRRCRPP